MSNFKIGEKVVCIDPIFSIIKNEIYTINSITNCKNCNNIMFTLNGIIKIKNENLSRCYCGTVYSDPNLFGIRRFRKLDYDFAEKLLAEIKEAVNSEFIKN